MIRKILLSIAIATAPLSARAEWYSWFNTPPVYCQALTDLAKHFDAPGFDKHWTHPSQWAVAMQNRGANIVELPGFPPGMIVFHARISGFDMNVPFFHDKAACETLAKG